MVNKGTSAPSGQTVEHVNIKRVLITIALATAGLVVFTLASAHTYQEKQRQQLNQTLQEKVELQKVLERNKLDSEKNQQEIERLKKELQAKRDGQARALAEAQKAPVRPVAARVAVSNPQCEQWMVAAGIPLTNASMQLVLKESGCRYNAVNRSSGACGIPQALPCSKLPCSLDAAGAVCQLRWMQGYVTARYGSWENAYAKWLSRSPHWY